MVTIEDIAESANMNKALKQVISNKGAPGVDGMRVEEIRAYLLGNGRAKKLSESIKSGTYRPKAVRAENIGIESDVASLRLEDMQNWFDVNWNTKLRVPRYDDKGKQISVQELTGKEIFATLLSLDLSEADLSRGLNRWRLRSEKNALGYGILRTLVGVGAGVAGAVATKGLTSTPPVEPQDYDTYQESYDRRGDYVGGTHVRRRYLRGK